MGLFTYSLLLFIFDLFAYLMSISMIAYIYNKTRFDSHLLLLIGLINFALRCILRYITTFYSDPNNEMFLLIWRSSYFFLFIAIFVSTSSLLLNSNDELPLYTHLLGVVVGILMFSYFNERWISPGYNSEYNIWHSNYELIPSILILVLTSLYLINVVFPIASKINREGMATTSNIFIVIVGVTLLIIWGVTANVSDEDLLGRIRFFFLPSGILIFSYGQLRDPFILSHSKTHAKLLLISDVEGKIVLKYSFDEDVDKEFDDLSSLLTGVNSVLNEIMKKEVKKGKERIIDRGEEKIIILGVKNLIAILIAPLTKKVLVSSLNLLLHKISEINLEANLDEVLSKEKHQKVCLLIEETIKPLLN